MARALSLAQPGDLVQLLPGSYGALSLNRQSGADSPKVIVRGDPALVDQQGCVESQASFLSATPLCPHGNVLISDLRVCGHGLSIRNLDTTGLSTGFYVGDNSCPDANHVSANHDIELVNSHFTYQSTLRGHDLLLSHTRIGPNEQICAPSHNGQDGDNLHIWPDASSSPWTEPYNITLDHDLIYDARLGNGSGGIAPHGCGWNAHTDLVQTLGYNNLSVTNSVFWGAVDGIWQDGLYGGTDVGNAVFRNNFIGPSGIDGGYGSWQVGNADPGTSCANGGYTYENNTFAFDGTPGLVYCDGSAGSNSVVRNNYFATNRACRVAGGFAQPSYDHNAFGTGELSCGANAVSCSAGFLYSPAKNSSQANFAHGWDLHLSSLDSCLKGRADQSSYAPTDFDGQGRPQGQVDLGADEIP